MKIIRSLETHPELFQSVLNEVAGSGMYAEGKFCKLVKSQLESLTDKQAVLTNSCGSALYLVYKWLADKGHKTALIQNNTFYATGSCAAEAGLNVCLVDSRSDCPSMSVDSLKDAFSCTDATVVVLTHIGGWKAKDYELIAQFCKENSLVLVEDCAHAIGLQGVGNFSDYACWSFYPTKAVPSGEGGAVTSVDSAFLDFASAYVQYGKKVVDGRMTYSRGMNFRMSEWDAAILSVQLNRLDEILTSRRADAERLQVIAPCLLAGESNFYKYIVRASNVVGMQTVGKVYARTDQLDQSMSAYAPKQVVGLLQSIVWSESHACLPVGEGLFEHMSEQEIRNALKKA